MVDQSFMPVEVCCEHHLGPSTVHLIHEDFPKRSHMYQFISAQACTQENFNKYQIDYRTQRQKVGFQLKPNR